jgi:hypothetical protein
MKAIPFLSACALLAAVPALCQLPQSHPELCGTPEAVIPAPLGMSAVSRTLQLRLFFAASPLPVEILGTDEVEQVCPLQDGRLVIFGKMMTGDSFSIVDPTKPVLLDTVLAYDPHLSPDRRWIVFRKFYPRQSDDPPSDEYLRYDLSRSPAENRAPDDTTADTFNVGTAIFPVGWKNLSTDNMGAPEALRHYHQSTFFWAPDSSAVVFGDENQGKRSVVFITLDQNGGAKASLAPFPDKIDCGSPRTTRTGRPSEMQGVDFGALGDRKVLTVELAADGSAPVRVQLGSEVFQPAQTENLVIPPKFGKVKGK